MTPKRESQFYFPLLAGVLAVACALAWFAQAQSAGPGTVRGVVRDSSGHPIAGATVYLLAGSSMPTWTTHTDSKGTYRLPALDEERYTIRVEMKGYATGTAGPFVVGKNEITAVDLTLTLLPKAPQAGSAALPEFFDDPQFRVAGVTQATNAGGHGSDVARRSAEDLAKATASLTANAKEPSKRAWSESEERLHQAVEREPQNFEANLELGEWLANQGRANEAIPYLEQAVRISPGDYESSYALARSCATTGNLEKARTLARSLQAEHDRAELHHLLGDIEEKQGNSMEAVQQYQRAAELNPSEPNLFDWGTEFMRHRAMQAAAEVFAKGNSMFPHSVRMLIGLGVALYAQGSYEQARKYVFAASDLEPQNPTPYMFLGKMLSAEKAGSEGFVQRMERFSKLQPQNAMGQYYYALSLRKHAGHSTDTSAQVESLLKKAVELDPKLAVAYLQLGILYSDRRDLSGAISAYQQAIDADPKLEEAHYRMAEAYRRLGETDKVQEQTRVYEKLSRENDAKVEQERREIQQFVFALRDQGPR